MRILAVLVLAVAGCAYVGAPASPSPEPTAAPTPTTDVTGAPTLPTTAEPIVEPTPTPDPNLQRHAQAEEAIQHWAAYMADKPADTLVFISDLTRGGGWRGARADDAKTAFVSGMIEATVNLSTETPPPGEVTWPDGTTQEVPLISAADALAAMILELRSDQPAYPCGDCLQVVGATLTTRTALTWHGDAQVPVWQFDFAARDEPMEPISYVAVRDRVDPSIWLPLSSANTDAAYGHPDDTQVTIVFGGGACDTGHSIEVVESTGAMVPIITTTVRGGACTLQRVGYALRVELAAPLGDRVVLDLDSGYPVPVYPDTPPDGLRPG